MFHDRTGALRQELLRSQRALLDALDQVGPDDWLKASPNEGWTVRDLLVHLTTAEAGFVPTLRRMAAGQGGVPADFDPNRWNASQLKRRAEIPSDQLRPELEKAHAEMLALLDTLDDAALDQRGQMSSGSEGSTEDTFRLVAAHKDSHRNDILAALRVASQPQTP
ncbi:MAG TPA: DinB family protein [Chloroflexota bacterium]